MTLTPLKGTGGILRIMTLVVGVSIIALCYSWTSNNITGLNKRYCFPVIPWLIYSVVILILLLIDLSPSAIKIQADWMGHFLGGGSILVTETFICTDQVGFCSQKIPTEVYIFLALGFAQGILYILAGYFVFKGPGQKGRQVRQSIPRDEPPLVGSTQSAPEAPADV